MCCFPEESLDAGADLILSLGDLAVLLKLIPAACRDAEDPRHHLEDCTRAKRGFEDLIHANQQGQLPAYCNGRGRRAVLRKNTAFFPLAVYEDENISEEDCRLIPREGPQELQLNITSLKGFEEICQALVTPMELVHYIYYRELFYGRRIGMDAVDRQKVDLADFGSRKTLGCEPVLRLFLSDQYGYSASSVLRFRLVEFKDFLQKFPSHFDAGQNNCTIEDVIGFMAHLSREEASSFIERLSMLIGETGRGGSGMLSSLRPRDDRYAIFFVAKDLFPISVIKTMIGQYSNVRQLLEVIAHRITEDNFNLEFQILEV